jgi:hypothetical protein
LALLFRLRTRQTGYAMPSRAQHARLGVSRHGSVAHRREQTGRS